MADSARTLVEEVLSPDMTREIWSGNYLKALPVSLQLFELSAVLPAVFYMFRFGQRRGTGHFLRAFGALTGTARHRRQSATVASVAGALAGADGLDGFNSECERAILGDLLLCFCLENVRRSLGRNQQVQRVAPTHYMASWVDLPRTVNSLRYVPEMLVAMLANQAGEYVDQNAEGDSTWFAVGRGHEHNVLTRAFSRGVTRRGKLGDLTSDRFDEADEGIGLDQLLMIRLAQQMHTAPGKLRGKEKDGHRISNQRPIAERAARNFTEDIRRFVRAYAEAAPRYALVEMLESCIAVGLTTVLTSTVEILFRWADAGTVPDCDAQHPAGVFVDCSNGIDPRIRARAEQSMDDLMRRLDRFPVILMALRLLDYQARGNRRIREEEIATRPYATAWLNLLGDVLHERHPEARRIHYNVEDKIEQLCSRLRDDHGDTAAILDDVEGRNNPIWRFAEGLMTLVGHNVRRGNFVSMVDSSFFTGRPNGLAVKRRARGSGAANGAMDSTREVRSLVFTDPVLDCLVHRHTLPVGEQTGIRHLSFGTFIDTLRVRHGFHVDTAPPGMTISNELLQRNRANLEQRLRDLGLLVGVNDAEAMKRLRPRFDPARLEDGSREVEDGR